VRNGFVSTPGLEEGRKKVGLEVFEKIYEQIDQIDHSSWFVIEQQSSIILNQINLKMKVKLKEFNVESVCQQIEKYVFENIIKKIHYEIDSACNNAPDMANELLGMTDPDDQFAGENWTHIFDELKFYNSFTKEDKVAYIEKYWKELDNQAQSLIKIQIVKNSQTESLRYLSGFNPDLTTMNPEMQYNPLINFNNDIIDFLYMQIKDMEIQHHG